MVSVQPAGIWCTLAVSTSTFLQPHQLMSPTLYSSSHSDASRVQSTLIVKTSDSIINPGPTTVRILKKIPRSSQVLFIRKLVSILDSIVNSGGDETEAWERFLYSVESASACQAMVATEEA